MNLRKSTISSVLIGFLSVFTISGCAQKASNINPAYISQQRYSDWSCEKLVKEKSFIDDALPRVSAQQDAAADNDALMVFLIGVPTSGGGVKSEVARLKGEQEAVRQVIRDKNCDGRAGPVTQVNNSNRNAEEDLKTKLEAIEKLHKLNLISDDEYKNMIKNTIN
jgi:hypothetical protein